MPAMRLRPLFLAKCGFAKSRSVWCGHHLFRTERDLTVKLDRQYAFLSRHHKVNLILFDKFSYKERFTIKTLSNKSEPASPEWMLGSRVRCEGLFREASAPARRLTGSTPSAASAAGFPVRARHM